MPKFYVTISFSTQFVLDTEDEEFIDWLNISDIKLEDVDNGVISDYVQETLKNNEVTIFGEPDVDDVRVEEKVEPKK